MGSACHQLSFTVGLCLEGLIRGDEAYLYEKVFRKMALCYVTLNLLSLNLLVWVGRVPLAPTLPSLLVSPPRALPWHLHFLFLPSIFRVISNLIAVSLLLPAAAVLRLNHVPRRECLAHHV